MERELSRTAIGRGIAQAARVIGPGACPDGRVGDAGATWSRWGEGAASVKTGGDSLPVVAAALGGLLFTCSALRSRYKRRIRSLEDEVVRLSDMAESDHLTGLGNRRSFEWRLAVEWQRALRSGSHLTLALIDIDFFKRFNDAYGHPLGDQALQCVAQCLSGTLGRAADSAFRIGGEEFALILPDTDQAGAGLIGERVCAAVRSAGILHRESPAEVVTTSFGSCSAIVRDGEQAGEFLSLADQALYKAKGTGRNRAVCFRRRPSVFRGAAAGNDAAVLDEAAICLD